MAESNSNSNHRLSQTRSTGPCCMMVITGTDKPGYNDVVFAEDVYCYTTNIVVTMIIIVRITKVFRRPYIVITRLVCNSIGSSTHNLIGSIMTI